MLVIDWQLVLNEILAWLSTEGVKLVFGVIVLFIVFKIINRFTRRMVKNAEKKNRDKTSGKNKEEKYKDNKSIISYFKNWFKTCSWCCFLGICWS